VPLEVGSKLDRYVILARLGAGGMGEVYRAHDARLQRDVALKILRSASEPALGGTGGADRILREARSAAALEHPNVIATYDVGETVLPGEHDVTAYIAMELVKGWSLRHLVGDRTVPMAERIRWLTDAARALAAAHKAGLVHRDIKPENVMLRDDGVIKVLDFGLAKRSSPMVAGHTTSSTDGQVLSTFHTGKSYAAGTPYYMAPEQIRNERIDGRADQFAWGVLAYELLAGIPPWSTEGDMLPLVAEILSDDPTPPRARDAEIPPAVEAVVLRTLSKARADRFASMDDVISALGGQILASHGSGRSTPVAFADTEAAIPRSSAGSVRRSRWDDRRSAPAVAAPGAPVKRSARRLMAAGAGLAIVLGTAAAARVRGKHDVPVTQASPAATARQCNTNRECISKLGTASICRQSDGTCASLASPDCKVLADDVDIANDKTVWIGTMFPLTVEPEKDGVGNARAVDLARQDFTRTMGAIGLQPDSGYTRPFGVISCDDGADASRAARHLVDDVAVPAVIGFRSSRELIDLAESLFLPRGLVAITALNTSPLIATLPHPSEGPRRIWRTTYDSAQTAWPLAAFVEDVLEPHVRTTPGVDASKPLRVALLRTDSRTLPFSEVFFRALRFNGRSALDNGKSYREFVVEPSEDAATAFRTALDEVLAFAPHVLVFEGAVDAGVERAKLLDPLEASWPSDRRWRPTYVKIEPLVDEDIAFVGSSADRRRRMFGLTMASNTPTNARLVMHYNQTFHADITRTLSPNTAYDAFYMLAYAVYALGDQPATGSNIARAFSRLLPPGKPIEVGPSNIFDAFNTLRAGQNIDLVGSSGSLDFDTTTGQAPTDDVILCVGVDDKGNASESVESGLVYDATAKKLVGKLHCP
jgi:serine/threonine-protein kinase